MTNEWVAGAVHGSGSGALVYGIGSLMSVMSGDRGQLLMPGWALVPLSAIIGIFVGLGSAVVAISMARIASGPVQQILWIWVGSVLGSSLVVVLMNGPAVISGFALDIEIGVFLLFDFLGDQFILFMAVSCFVALLSSVWLIKRRRDARALS